VQGELHLTAREGELPSYAEVEQDGAWRAAMQDEIKSIEDNRTWELVELSCGYRAIELCWVYKVKKDELGAVIKSKARLGSALKGMFNSLELISKKFLLQSECEDCISQ
jgi:hypothetical protein